MRALTFAIVVAAGLLAATQVAVMGELGKRTGVFATVAFASVVTLACSLLLLAFAGGGLGKMADVLHEPSWLWVGGLLGLFVVTAATYGPPRVGVGTTVVLIVAGQLVAGVVIDRLGLIGDPVYLRWPRVLGLVLLAAGTVLAVKR